MPALAEDLSGSLLSTFHIAIFLYGTATSQIYNYWQNFPYDSKLHRWTVGVATVTTEVMLAGIVQRHVKSQQQIQTEIHPDYGSFYIRRVWIYRCRPACSYRFKFDIISQFRQNTSPVITVSCGLSSAAAIDLLLAITLVYYRLKMPRRAHENLHVVEALQYYLVNTGLITIPSGPQHIAYIYLLAVYTHGAYSGIRWSDPSSSKIMSERAEIQATVKEARYIELARRITRVELYHQDDKLTGEDMSIDAIPATIPAVSSAKDRLSTSSYVICWSYMTLPGLCSTDDASSL
ncbi:predicted protein [Postia placenta Mad-698-R]|nr:predicted protein [Postia placenta Mad-698-R]